MQADADLILDMLTLEQALKKIEVLESTVQMLKRQIADETAQRYAAYQRIVELQEELHKTITSQ